MEILKKIVDHVSAFLEIIPQQGDAGKVQTGKRLYGMPDYSAYVPSQIKGGIPIVSFSEQMQSQFEELASAYERACQSYNSVSHITSVEHNYRKAFERLNAIFALTVQWFCKHASVSFSDTDIVQSAMNLKKAGFNKEQMNVVSGVLYAMDVYRDESLNVPDDAIEKHFVSVGCLLEILQATAAGKETGTVPCRIQSAPSGGTMKRQPAKKAGNEKKTQSSKRPAAKSPDEREIDAIQKAFEKTQKLSKKTDCAATITALKEVTLLALQRICKIQNIQFPEPFPENRKAQEYITKRLHLLGAIDKASVSTVNSIMVLFSLICVHGFEEREERIQGLVRNIGSTLIPMACIVPKKAPNPPAKNKVSKKRPSFKAMEKKAENGALDLKTEYPELVRFIETARKRSAAGEYEDALHSLRNALEFIVNTLCQKYTIAVEPKTSLLEKIDLIASAGVISDAQRDILHRVRKLGNIGAHHGIKEATENKVHQGMDLIQQATTVFTNLTLLENTNENKPMIDPDYFSSSRKYYGLWNNAIRMEKLLINPNYVQLCRRADAGDIEAMLDIAVGFLPDPDQMNWGMDHLILSPNFAKKGYRLFPDAFEARYYFWILKAGRKAYDDWMAGKVIPLKYIANALMEGITFSYCHCLYQYYAPRYVIAETQYGLLQHLFPGDPLTYNGKMVANLALMLICMLEEYKGDMEGKGSILTPVLCYNPDGIRTYVYMYHYFTHPEQRINLDPKLLLSPDDAGKTFYRVVSGSKRFDHFKKVASSVKDWLQR